MAAELSNEDKVKRLIYLGNVLPRYISGDPCRCLSSAANIEILDNMITGDAPVDLLRIVSTVNEDIFIPHRCLIYHVLAFAITSEKIAEKYKSKITETIFTTCKSDKDFFDFIKFVSSFRDLKKKSKLPHTVGKAVRKYYGMKSPMGLAGSYARYNSYHRWTHKDLIKLAHVQSPSHSKAAIVHYILFKETKKDVNIDEDTERALDLIKKCETLRKTTDPKIALPLIFECNATINQIEPALRKSAEVWNATLPNMSLIEILQSLPKLYKLGFLKRDTPTQALINETLTNTEGIEISRIHPIEVFIFMKLFEKGGKPLDPKLLEHLAKEKKLTEEEINKLKTPMEAKCPVVLNNLQLCMYLSCNNVQPLGKKYMITIDVTDKKDTPCLHNKHITSLEAAVAFAVYLLRVEKDVIVAVYKDKDISIVQVDKKGQFYEIVQKFRQLKSNYLIPIAPVEWALSQKKNVDIFLNFIHHKEYRVTVPKDTRDKLTEPLEAFRKYKETLNLPNAKLINFCMSSPQPIFTDGSRNILDVAGLDLGTFKVVEAFCRDNFC